ncbi:hypothetical protein CAEBREN_02309 [Caenorhabditis brenneri]|uniref:Uncharacterized protein n=1 Tax=Caenorhabditis brenneri TaxID=135651 RepID=G0N5J0_CAEBE|nr:hypothetical protein CAEBREN_02309 [Caenorhabditis brenneri]
MRIPKKSQKSNFPKSCSDEVLRFEFIISLNTLSSYFHSINLKLILKFPSQSNKKR